jgi:hypothetical protein
MDVRDTIRLIIAVAGAVFFGIGILMLYVGIKAEGSLDVSTGLFSGQLKTGDAGVIVLFLSFILMLASLIRFPSFAALAFGLKNNRQRAVALLVSLVVLGAIAVSFAGQVESTAVQGFLFFFGGLLIFFFFTALVSTFDIIFAEDPPQPGKDNK